MAGNATNIAAPAFYPDTGNCVYSGNGSYLYCADNGLVGDVGFDIKQMSVNATSLTPLVPFAVVAESTGVNSQGPKSVVLHPSGNFLFAFGVTNIFSFPRCAHKESRLFSLARRQGF